MKKIHINLAIVSLLFSLPILAGCTKAGATGLSSDNVPKVIDHAFNQSSGDTKAMVSECVSAYQARDVATAFSDLQKLSQHPDLSPEQRAVTARAMAATFPILRSASDNGDAAAQAVLHQYLSTR